MKQHPTLKKIATSLSAYCIEFLHPNCLTVAIDKKTEAFAFLVIEDAYPEAILSLALDFSETFILADMLIRTMKCSSVALGEAFYRSKSGALYWDQEAFEIFQLENDSEILKNIAPINNSIN